MLLNFFLNTEIQILIIIIGSFYLQDSQDFLLEYLDYRDKLLENLLIFEAHNAHGLCSDCNSQPGLIRCNDCLHSPIFCQQCLLKQHIHLPFHHVEQWDNNFFNKSSLYDHGFVIHLGHCGLPCPHAQSTPSFDTTLTLVHVNGIFKHRVQWCSCPNAKTKFLQLFHTRLFSASFKQPKTAFTFDLLDYYYIDSMECKTAAMAFFQKLKRLSNNAFPDEIEVCDFFCIEFSILIFYFILE